MYQKQASLYTVLLAYLQEITDVDDECSMRQVECVAPVHCYTNFTRDGRFRFPTAGKAVRRGLEATVNRGLTAAGGFARRG